jgi:hypothetical protein
MFDYRQLRRNVRTRRWCCPERSVRLIISRPKKSSPTRSILEPRQTLVRMPENPLSPVPSDLPSQQPSLKFRLRDYDQKLGDPTTVALRVYLHDRAFCSTLDDDVLFRCRDIVRRELFVPLNAVNLAGSGQIGWSISRKLPFSKNKSDLDLAVVDALCFQSALEDVIATTRTYTDLTGFERPDTPSLFRDYASRGIIRADLMPKCETRKRWRAVFQRISREASSIAKDASFVVYLSESLFIGKQQSALNFIRRNHQ